jgi:hypothetical protein
MIVSIPVLNLMSDIDMNSTLYYQALIQLEDPSNTNLTA